MKSFKQQFDRLTEEYIHNRIEPLQNCACFVGNLLGGKSGRWGLVRDVNGYGNGCIKDVGSPGYIVGALMIMISGYTIKDILRLENTFLGTINHDGIINTFYNNHEKNLAALPDYEDRLFNAFVATLDVLRQIHIEKGEVIDEIPEFKKRQLPCVSCA